MARLIISAALVILALAVSTLVLSPLLLRYIGQAVGRLLRKRTQARRSHILSRVAVEEREYASKLKSDAAAEEDWETVEGYAAGTAKNGEKADQDWEGVVGFFHPFCNAGGGGERVLWAAIRATQKRWPKAVCIVYTGDHNVDKTSMLDRAKNRFNIPLHAPTIALMYLSTRQYILSSTYPHFTLLGQSLGSLVLAYDAFSLLVPDIFVDTMGFAFTIALSKFFFPEVPTGAYVHYPTISTDMLGSLREDGKGVNAGSGSGLKGLVKQQYWRIFASMYSWVGGNVDLVMTNSSWTQAHIQSLWGQQRQNRKKQIPIKVIFPPVAVEEIEREVDVTPASEKYREKILIYIAQFRPEKDHTLILNAFAKFYHTESKAAKGSKLVLVGSVRDSEDATRVYKLRLLAHELKVKDHVEFICDASWPEILQWLRLSSIGVNGMWNEHFGIGVVEYQAAGLISVVNNSGGPKGDIVVEIDGKPTGFHASTADEYAIEFEEALSLSGNQALEMRQRARKSAKRFTEEEFAKRWNVEMDHLIALQIKSQPLQKRG